MRVDVSFKNISEPSHEGIRERLRDWADKHLQPLLGRVGGPDPQIVATVSKRPKGGRKFAVKLHMHLPRRKILVARSEGHDLPRAMHEAGQRLLKEVHRHVDHLRHQAEFHRKARRTRLHELKAGVASLPQDVVEAAKRGVEPALPRVENVVRRELAYLRATGDLGGDYPTARDIVDEAVAEVTIDWREAPAKDVEIRLLRAAFTAIDREIEAHRCYGDAVSLESPPKPDAEDVAEAMVQEEFYEFYQPDERLQLADVIADEESPVPGSPEEDEAQTFTLEAMRSLPIRWRRMLLLREAEQFPVTHIALILQEEVATVESCIAQADAFLRAQLEDAGMNPRWDRARALSGGTAESVSAQDLSQP